jgi:3-hydroxymyristoyl/3-hydroxydecanoyl-(acyl carrier protein) dehydratase
MDSVGRAFSFVDRIDLLEYGHRITGRYRIPDCIESFPNSLVSESVGQLAAWAGMAAVNFTHRPVAGIARRVEMFQPPQPGQTLDLAAEIESVEHDAMAYSGSALVDGRPVVRLKHCVGPMMPIAEFDDPSKVEARFTLLRTTGAGQSGFRGVPELPLQSPTMTSATSMQTWLHVPEQAAFFADHFPRRPIFPGTLLTHVSLKLAATLLQSSKATEDGWHWAPTIVTDVKLRTFTAPGEKLELEATTTDSNERSSRVTIQIRNKGKRVGRLRAEFTLEASR